MLIHSVHYQRVKMNNLLSQKKYFVKPTILNKSFILSLKAISFLKMLFSRNFILENMIEQCGNCINLLSPFFRQNNLDSYAIYYRILHGKMFSRNIFQVSDNSSFFSQWRVKFCKIHTV